MILERNATSRRQLLRGALAAGAMSCAAPSIARSIAPNPAAGLDALAKTKGMRFGTAIAAADLDDPAFVELLCRDCSILVGENAFKWKHVEPRSRQFDFSRADRIYEWSQQNGMALRGHTLAWNQDNRLPEWLVRVEEEDEAVRGPLVEQLLRSHAETIITRYPAIASWDVVNEMILLGNGEVRSSVLSRALGDRIMDVCFGIARDLAPGTQLAYNDYMSWNRKPDHKRGVLRLLEEALGRGVPIDALGIQAHLVNSAGGDVDEAGWREFLDEVQGMGLTVVITELDCADQNIAATSIAERDRIAAEHVRAFLDLTLSYENVSDILLWDMTDRDSYVRSARYANNRPREDGTKLRAHPYDDALQPKPMYAAIADAFRAAPDRRA